MAGVGLTSQESCGREIGDVQMFEHSECVSTALAGSRPSFKKKIVVEMWRLPDNVCFDRAIALASFGKNSLELYFLGFTVLFHSPN